MTETSSHSTRRPKLTRGRAAALGCVLGAGLVLAPIVWAEGASDAAAPAAATSAPQTMTAPVALIQQQSFAPLVRRVLPAVVNISVTQKSSADQMSEEPEMAPSPDFPDSPFDQFMRRFFQQMPNGGQNLFPQVPGGEAQRIALGSGFIIDPRGYVVTNNHVIGNAEKVEVILQDKKRYRAKLVGRDAKTDLAVLKIKADKPLPYVTFGDSSAAQVGDWVMAVGNPFGLGGTVTTGIISARGRDINEGPYDDFLQIDAPINRGNSGGPTFNLEGQVIGINTAIYSPNGGSVGIGFAIPSNEAKTIVGQLEAHGTIERGWLGVQIQQVTPAIAASLGLKDAHGALVALVTPNSPAASAGLKQGDVILTFNGSKIAELRDLPRLVADTAPDSKASLGVWRDGRTVSLETTVGELKNNPKVAAAESGNEAAPAAEATAVGMHFEPLTEALRGELHLGRDVHGVVVSKVDNGSAAEDGGVDEGDVVVAINQQQVDTPQQAAEKLNAVAHSSKKSALLLLNRHGTTEYIGVSLNGHNQG